MVNIGVLALLLSGCATLSNLGESDRGRLVTASNSYNRMLRWKELDMACGAFVEESGRRKCVDRAAALKDVQVTDVRTRNIEYSPAADEATVHAEIEYYLLPSPRVKTLTDVQQWKLVGPEERKVWVIRSSFPDFPVP